MSRTSRCAVVVFAVFALLLTLVVAPAASADSGRSRGGAESQVKKAARALTGGDEKRIEELESIVSSAEGTRWTLDEGLNPGEGATQPGPYSLELHYDTDDDLFRLDYDLVSFGFVDRQVSEIVNENAGFIVGQDNNFGPPDGQAAMLTDRWVSTRLHQHLMNPAALVQIMLTEDLDIDRVGRARIDGRRQDVLRIRRDDAPPLRVFLDKRTHLITQVTTEESDPLRRDVRLEVRYFDWTGTDAGILAPGRVKVYYDGELVQDEIRTSTVYNTDIDDSLFEPPAGLVFEFDSFLAQRGVLSHQHIQSFAALGFPRDGIQLNVESTEFAPGVHWITGGSHHSLLVEQDDGFVLVEAPLDEYRAQALLDFVAANFDDRLITHIVQSHHHADHSAGVRTILAQGATLVAGDTAVSFWSDVVRARSRILPDALSRSDVRPPIEGVPVGDSIAIGSGPNEVGVHSFVQPHATDLLFVEAGGVGFIVDLFNPGAGPIPQVLLDLIAERNLEVNVLTGGHAGFVELN